MCLWRGLWGCGLLGLLESAWKLQVCQGLCLKWLGCRVPLLDVAVVVVVVGLVGGVVCVVLGVVVVW